MPPPAGTKAPRTAEMLAKMRKQPYNPHGGQKNDTGRPALPPPPNGSNGNPAVDFFRPLFGNKKISVIFAPTTGDYLSWLERLHGMQEVTSSTLVFSTTPVRMDTSPSLFFYRNPSPASTNIPLYHPAATGRRLGAAPSGYGQNREQARPGQKKRQSAAKKTQSPVIQDNDRQRTRLLKKISALYRHYREHRF